MYITTIKQKNRTVHYKYCIHTCLTKLLIVNELVVSSLPTPLTMSTRPSMRLPSQGRVSNMIVLPARVLFIYITNL